MNKNLTANIENMRNGNKVFHNRSETNFKEQHTLFSLDILDSNGNPLEMVTLRIYGTKSISRACVWISSKDKFARGGGNSGKNHVCESYAVQDAFLDAGVTFSKEIAGYGQEAILNAMEAVADALNSKQYFISHAHG